MKNIAYFLITFFFIISITGCNDTPPEVEPIPSGKVRINIQPLYKEEPLDFNTVYLTQEGYRIQFTKLNFIATKFKNNNHILFESAVYRHEENGSLLFEGQGDYTKFGAITGHIGVTENQNHEDPSARTLEDPLNIMNTSDMHWGWNPGYIFTMIEGKIDTTSTPGAELSTSFLYHIGLDALLQEISLTNITWIKLSDHLHATNWYLDADKLFNGIHNIDIKEDRSLHTSPGQEILSEKIIVNLKDAIRTQ